MSDCKARCFTEELFADFAKLDGKHIQPAHLQAVAGRLAEHAARAGKHVCELGAQELQEFVQLLYSLEKEGRSADESFREICIIGVFYDYLLYNDCIEENPVTLLRQQTIAQLLGKVNDAYRQEALRLRKEGKKEDPEPEAEDKE